MISLVAALIVGFSFTIPKLSIDGISPAAVKQIHLDIRLDGGKWIPYWGGPLTVHRAGAWDGRRLSWMRVPNGLVRDSLGVRVACADSAGNVAPWAHVTWRKR